jgi:hypothetical protein
MEVLLMRSKIVIALAAVTFAVVGCEKRDTNTNTKTIPEHTTSTGIGGGPSSASDDNAYGGKDGGYLSGDPQHGAESLSGGGAKTEKGASGESMAGDAGK